MLRGQKRRHGDLPMVDRRPYRDARARPVAGAPSASISWTSWRIVRQCSCAREGINTDRLAPLGDESLLRPRDPHREAHECWSRCRARSPPTLRRLSTSAVRGFALTRHHPRRTQAHRCDHPQCRLGRNVIPRLHVAGTGPRTVSNWSRARVTPVSQRTVCRCLPRRTTRGTLDRPGHRPERPPAKPVPPPAR